MRSTTNILISSCALAFAFLLVLGACSGDEGKPSNGTSSGTTTTPPVEDSGAVEEASTTSKKKNAETCTKNEECESNICFMGGSGGGGGNQQYCSIACTAANAATLCVAPFTGACNGRGFCKRD